MINSVCSSCGARIAWANTSNNRRMPLDLTPREDGNVIIMNGIAHVMKAGEETDRERYVSHFATCPNAKSHKRKDRTLQRTAC